MKKFIIRNMTFKFDAHGPTFFENINVSFESSRIYFVQGKNGVGKSTFFSILQGTTPHNAFLHGAISFESHEFSIKNNILPIQLYSQVKTVTQDINKMIVTTLTVEENLQLAQLPAYPTLTPLSYNVKLPSILDSFSIERTKQIYKLSGGQKQILAIMMALQKPTKILLLDEPTAALDEKNTEIVMKFLSTVAKELEIIIIIITHDKELITTYASNGTILITRKENDYIRTVEQS